MVRALDNEEVASVLDMETTIELVEQAFRAMAEGRAVNVPRSDMILPLGANEAYVYKVMSGLIEDISIAASRVQSDHIDWRDSRKVKVGEASGGRYVQYVTVYDTEKTEPILLYNDGYVSKMRVGATNAVGAKYLAPPGATTMALLGVGRQATGQIEALASVLDLDRIVVYSPTREHRESFAERWNDRLDPTVEAVDSTADAVRGVDVLACSSNAMEPIFDADWIDPGTFVSAIKNPELPVEVFDRADLVAVTTTDSPSGPNNFAPKGSDFGERLTDHWDRGIDPETALGIVDVVADDVGPPGEDETRLFVNNLGIGVQFAAVGRHLFERAEADDLGVEMDVNPFLQSVW